MPKMKSKRPLYVNGQVATEFETTEQHARELEAAGKAERVNEQGEADAKVPAQEQGTADKGAAILTSDRVQAPRVEEKRTSATAGEDAERRMSSNRDDFEREPKRGEKKGKG